MRKRDFLFMKKNVPTLTHHFSSSFFPSSLCCCSFLPQAHTATTSLCLFRRQPRESHTTPSLARKMLKKIKSSRFQAHNCAAQKSKALKCTQVRAFVAVGKGCVRRDHKGEREAHTYTHSIYTRQVFTSKRSEWEREAKVGNCRRPFFPLFTPNSERVYIYIECTWSPLKHTHTHTHMHTVS